MNLVKFDRNEARPIWVNPDDVSRVCDTSQSVNEINPIEIRFTAASKPHAIWVPGPIVEVVARLTAKIPGPQSEDGTI